MRIAIFGAGLMGRAIAVAFAQQECDVVIYDSSASARAAAQQEFSHKEFSSRIKITDNFADALEVEVILETIVEKKNAKLKLYQQIAAALDEKKIAPPFLPFLFTNTSTISINVLCDSFSPVSSESARLSAAHFCGLHFFHPVAERPLVEIIPHAATSAETIRVAQKIAARLEKEAILVGDGAGFLVNRLLNPYLTRALTLAENAGRSYEEIDAAAETFGMAKGPFRLMDEIGLDVVWHSGFVMHKAFPDRVGESPLLENLVRHGNLGQKTGSGFYSYPRENFICAPHENFAEQNLAEHLLRGMFEEAIRCRDDGIISDLHFADIASIKGLGFPTSRGGIVNWGESHLFPSHFSQSRQ